MQTDVYITMNRETFDGLTLVLIQKLLLNPVYNNKFCFNAKNKTKLSRKIFSRFDIFSKSGMQPYTRCHMAG